MFELEVEGLLFSESWNELRVQKTFKWDDYTDKQHEEKDPYFPYDARWFDGQPQDISTKDTIKATESGLREPELALKKQEEKLESGFDSVFEQLATYTGQPVPVSKPQV